MVEIFLPTYLTYLTYLTYNTSIAVLPIILGPETPVLRSKTQKIPKVTKEIQKLLRDMQDTVKDAQGAGLAAPQIGQSLRMCLALINGRMTPLINPDITWKSDEKDIAEEGCLSIPKITVEVPRSREITMRYQDAKGKTQERKLADFDARVVQHEVDHLDGVLIVDYL